MMLSRRSSVLRHPAKQGPAGLGLDLVSLKRMKRFVALHRSRLSQEILSSPERRKFKRQPISSLLWAKLFSAKEAYFKTLDRSWLGREGFRKIEIRPLSDHFFQACWIEKRNRLWRAEGSWALTENHVMAQVIRWKNTTKKRG